LKNYEILLIRHGVNQQSYPNVGRVYTSPHADCVNAAQLFYPGHTLHTALNFRGRDSGNSGGESDKEFAVRCVAGLNQLFSDITQGGIEKSALITHDEIIVTLMAGCGVPKMPPTDFILQPGEGWLIKMSAFLWQKGYAFEIVGKLLC
jgi:hypothetical protein